jgi:O-antigen/teichoic acid export membrane protein
MSLFIRFKKDYFNYLISIILPAFISGISVPVFKHLLGAAGYGNFSIYYNAVLICTAVTTGWITQSIYRFYPASNNQSLFAKLSISIARVTQLICFLPVLIYAWYIKNDLLLGIFLCVSIFITALQFSYMAITQSSFLSRKTIYSETIRAVSYILIAVIFLLVTPRNYLYVLFLSVIVSFSLSVFYLRWHTRQFFLNSSNVDGSVITSRELIKKFFNYGAPLSMWFVFTYLLSYVDKILILKNIGAEAQGNYQAIFDLLSKGIIMLISPVVISLFPLLTQAYEKGEIVEIRSLLKKIILFEMGGFILAVILYWLFGANILFKILKVPDTQSYRLMGFIVIAGAFIMQIAMVVHKRYELKKMSLFLLGVVMAVFAIQLVFYWIFRKSVNPLVYPIGYLLSSVIYLFFVSFSQFPFFFKSLIYRVKSFYPSSLEI